MPSSLRDLDRQDDLETPSTSSPGDRPNDTTALCCHLLRDRQAHATARSRQRTTLQFVEHAFLIGWRNRRSCVRDTDRPTVVIDQLEREHDVPIVGVLQHTREQVACDLLDLAAVARYGTQARV